MKHQLLILFLSLLFLNSFSCNTTDPPEDSVTPGRRDYVWTVDTLKIPFNFLSRISGSSPTDLWAVGPGGGLDETLWHYDGISWSTDKISRNISPLCVYSFSKDNVWIAGYEGKIWHFDGSQWKQSMNFKKPNYTVGFSDIWGDSPQSIYAVGYADSGNTRRGIILYYNGTTWLEKKIPDFSYAFIRIKKDKVGKYYVRGYGPNTNNGEFTGIFEYDGNANLTNIYEAIYNLSTNATFQLLSEKLYFVIGKKINTYENNQFRTLTEINEQNFGGQIFGRSSKDILIRMLDGIAQYNGTNIEYLFSFDINNGISISDAIVFEKEVFFLADEFSNNQNLIIKGKLK